MLLSTWLFWTGMQLIISVLQGLFTVCVQVCMCLLPMLMWNLVPFNCMLKILFIDFCFFCLILFALPLVFNVALLFQKLDMIYIACHCQWVESGEILQQLLCGQDLNWKCIKWSNIWDGQQFKVIYFTKLCVFAKYTIILDKFSKGPLKSLIIQQYNVSSSKYTNKYFLGILQA